MLRSFYFPLSFFSFSLLYFFFDIHYFRISEAVTKDFNKNQEIKQMMKQPDAYIKGLLENLDDNISEKDIILQRKVGEGAYGSVFLAVQSGAHVKTKWRPSSNTCAPTAPHCNRPT